MFAESSGIDTKSVEFDFLAEGELVRTSLGEHISERGVSPEGVITVEYVERLPAPQPQDCLLHDDWVSSVHVADKWFVLIIFAIEILQRKFNNCANLYIIFSYSSIDKIM